jgi:hypothetical protein
MHKHKPKKKKSTYVPRAERLFGGHGFFFGTHGYIATIGARIWTTRAQLKLSAMLLLDGD